MPERLIMKVRRVEGAPVVAIRLWLRGGARAEAIPGQALVTGRMLTEGTRSRDWKRIADEAESKGMILSSYSTLECHGVSVDALSRDWEQALDWAVELLLDPAFPEDRCSWVAKQAAAELESLTDQPDVKTAWGFLGQLYAPHPRARPLHGSVESLLGITPDHCSSFHAAALTGGVKVAVAGVIDEEPVRKRLESLLANPLRRGETLPEPPAPAGTEERAMIETDAEDQAHLFVGHLTVPRNHPDYTALEMVAVTLGSGAGLTGRIPTRIREQEGLAYSAHAQTVAGSGEDPGRLVAYVGTSPATVARAEAGVIEEIERLVQDGIEPAELEEARAYLLGREPFRRETARQWADLLTEAVQYGLPLDDPALREQELRALDLKAVEEATRRHIRPWDLRVTVGLPV
jgi:zinc protease